MILHVIRKSLLGKPYTDVRNETHLRIRKTLRVGLDYKLNEQEIAG